MSPSNPPPSAPPERRSRLIAGAAIAVAASAAANCVAAEMAERRHPPRGLFVTAEGVRLHYLEHGGGPPVVMLHGNGALAEDFAISGVLDDLARDHRVIVFDRPGFGYSERPRDTRWTATAQAALLRIALDQLGVRRPVLVGHSWGTLVALAMAMQDQANTAGLALLAGYYFPTARTDVALMSLPALPVLGDVMRYTGSPLVGRLLAPRFIRELFAPAPVSAEFAAQFPIGLALRPWQIRAMAEDTALMIPSAAALCDRHRELAVPTTIIAGTGDRIVAIERQSARLHEEVAGSEFHAIQGSGHMVHHTAPDRVTAAIRAVGAAAGQPARLAAA